MEKVAALLREYLGLFPIKLSNLKGIIGDMGVMKIALKLDANLVKQCPYRLNLMYKEKMHEELDKMLVAVIIEPVEESD